MKQPPTPIHKTTSPKHREDYVFVEKSNEDFTALKLISGPYASIVYKYGNVGFADESKKTAEGALPMRFDYTIIENGIMADTDSQDFIDHIGDILVVLLEEQMQQTKDNEDIELSGKN